MEALKRVKVANHLWVVEDGVKARAFLRRQGKFVRKASANPFQRWPAMSRSVWSAPYSGALISGTPFRQRFCNGFAEALRLSLVRR
jgi:hypothetical protein